MKKLLSLLLAGIMAVVSGNLITEDQFIVQAAEADPVEVKTESDTYINPLYRDVLSEEDLVKGAEGGISTYAEPRYETDERILAQTIREAMINREDTIMLYYASRNAYDNTWLEKWFEKAMEETDDSHAGDYLRWNYAGYHGGISYYVQSGVYYYTYTITVTYYTNREQEQELDRALASVMQELRVDDPQMSDYEKVKKIYDYICKNISYDYDNLNNNEYFLKYTAYAALVNKTAVCQGYSALVYRMLEEAGIDVRFISGYAGDEAHAWNLIGLGSNYYYLDSTWDAGRSNYQYFLKGTKDFSGHVPSSDQCTFLESYQIADTAYAVTGIRLNKNRLELQAGTSEELKVEIQPKGLGANEEVRWSSSNSNIAAVDVSGRITAVNKGKAVITVKSAGRLAECEVTVVEDSGSPGDSGTKPPVSPWVQDANGWWYRNEDGSYPHGCWKLIDNKWYYFNSAGYRVTDWKSIGGKWYYFEPTTGVMQTGWLSSGNTSYYLTSSGAMAVGWHEVDGIWYYFESSGVMKRGWHWNGSRWYYLNSDGTMAVKWNSVKGVWYYFESSGAMKTGWLKDGSTWYYFEGSGAMKKGWLKQGNKWYYLRTSGDMATGWEKVGIDTYYFLPSGEMVTDWNLIDGSWHYFKGSGAMQTGWLKNRSIWYYLDADGKMVTGWREVEGYTYYFDPSGAMYTGVHVIDGITYDFGSSGGIKKRS